MWRIYPVIFLFALSGVQAQQPNIVFIISDDAGFADWGFMDSYTQSVNPGQISSPVPTPNLDRLRERGVLFTNAYTAAVCSPSRAALLTGSYQQRIGYEFNINNLTDPNGNFEGLRSEDVTIFERMGARGYTTGAIGKWHVGGIQDVVEGGVVTEPGNRPPRQGVDEFFGILRGSRSYAVGPTAGDVTRAVREMSLDTNGLEVNTDVEAAHAGEYVTNTFGQGAVDFIDRHYLDVDPFFLYVSFTAPHSPIGPSPDRNEPGISSDYGSMVFTMDKEIGRIMDKITDPAGDGSVDLTADTLFVFINDNGGAAGIGARNTPLRNFKGSTYEGGVRVPMIFAGAGVTAAPGATYSAPVHSIDVLATCHELAGGVPLTGEIDGVNLLPFINGTAVGVPHEAIVIRNRGRYGVRMGDWKLTYTGSGLPELYDLSTSIDEAAAADVAAANPGVVAQMVNVLTEHEVGFDKPRFHGLSSAADSINRNDEFKFVPLAPDGSSFTPDLVLVAPGMRNGGFESPAFETDQHSFSETGEWTNIGTGTQDEALVRTNLNRTTPQNAVISESGARVAAIDTGHTLAEGEVFQVSYWWRDASGWNDGADRMGFTFYTTDDDTIAGPVAGSTELLSETSTANSSYEQSAGTYMAGAGEAGRRLFVSFAGVDGNGASGGFARVDDVRIERGTVGTSGGGPRSRNWSEVSAWTDGDTGQADTLLDIDAFAGAVLEFPISGGFSYIANNDMTRATGEEFMLNKIVLSGTSEEGGNSCIITGNALLFVRSLTGEPAMIVNNTSGEEFSYMIETPIIPWGELIIAGDGTSPLSISGVIRDFDDENHIGSITKRGGSVVTLVGEHQFDGSLSVEGGLLLLDETVLTDSAGLALGEDGAVGGRGTVTGHSVLAGTVLVDLAADGFIEFDGGLEIAGASLVLSGAPTEPVQVIASYGLLDGVFASVSGLSPGATIDYAFGGNEIAIVTGVDPYTNWAESISGLSGAAAEFGADPNSDGVANGVAFFLGAADATIGARDLLPEVATSGGNAVYTFTRSESASGYGYVVRYASHLGGWTSAIDGVDGIVISNDGEKVTTTLPLSLGSGGRLFLSLSIPEL